MLQDAIRWWLVIEAIGLIALPIALLLFRPLPGRGIAFAKPLGLLLTGYLFWLALVVHLLPNRPGSVVWVLIVLAAVDYFILRRRWSELRHVLSSRLGLIIAVELVFMAVFFAAAHIKTFIPEINGTEKPMDFLFLNAADRSRYYPPQDPWLSGFDVSYYYFGYVIQAMIGKLAGVTTAVGFNLALASTAGLAAVAAFGVGFEIVRGFARTASKGAIVAGLGAVMLVAVIGNLEGVLEFGAANDTLPASVAERVEIEGLDTAPPSNDCLLPVVCIKYPTEQSSFWWWWRATRISPDAGTITEFPFFSFILGDLHPHVMAIPFVLTVVGLGLAFWRWGEDPEDEGGGQRSLSFDTWRGAPAVLFLSSVLVGGLGFLNTWDLPTFGFLLALLVFARNLRGRRGPGVALVDAISFLLPLAVAAFVLYSPFYLGFGSQADGLGAVTNGATRPVQSLLFWGPLAAVALPLPLFLLARDPIARSLPRVWSALGLPALLLIVWLLVMIANGDNTGDAIEARGWNWLTTLFFGSMLVAMVLALWRAVEKQDEDEGRALVPVLAAMAVAVLLIFGAELFFVRDLFGSRLNTVFKLYYQAWLLLGVSGAGGAWWLLSRAQPDISPVFRTVRDSWTVVAAIVLLAALLYPLGATLSRTEGLAKSPRTLDGLAYANGTALSTDLRAAEWLEDHAEVGERLVEATGGEYSVAGRMSSWTGIPSILGWQGHEKQWGRDDRTLAVRANAVKTIYESTSLDDALPILQQYGVTYVVVGSVERATYPAAGLQKFDNGLVSAFTVGSTTIYRMPPTLENAGIEGARAGEAAP